MSYHLTALSTVSGVIVMMLVAKNDVTNETKIPAAVIKSGKNMASGVFKS
jgi:hypothetical protein